MKLIVAGGRNYNNYPHLKKTLDAFRLKYQVEEIVSGAAHGVDTLGEQYAKEHGISLKQFPADWNKHKKAAGPIRNAQMAEYGDCLLAFWDGSSKGTKNMIDNMHKQKKPVYVSMINIEVKAHGST